jgi:malonyl CoA-acyl carrier protein transacylase
LIDALPLRDGFTPLIGNAHGQLIQTPAELRDELRGQYTRPIHWVAALQTAYDLGVRRFAVLGPGNAMAGLVRRFGTSVDQRPTIVRLNQSR